jgi:hypothetical protein
MSGISGIFIHLYLFFLVIDDYVSFESIVNKKVLQFNRFDT